MSEQVDKAWLDVARMAGRQDRDMEVHELRAESERLRTERDEAHCEIAKLVVALERLRERYDFQVDANRSLVEVTAKAMAESEQLRMALSDVVNRWSTKRGFDSAIVRAHHALDAGLSTAEDVRGILKP
jgi:hypothetical protein